MMKCQNCGAETKNRFCEYCGSDMCRKEGESIIYITNNYYGTATSRTPVQTQIQHAQTEQRTEPEIKHLGLWILGWVFIFPVPLTVLLFRNKQMSWLKKLGWIIFAWILYGVVLTWISSDEETTDRIAVDSTTEKRTEQESREENEDYSELQKVFLELTMDSTEEELLALIERNGLVYRVQEKKGTPRKNHYSIIFNQDVTSQNQEFGKERVDISFDKTEGTLLYAEYYNQESVKQAIYYNYGIHWCFREKKPDNRYTGYYYHNPEDAGGGIILQHSNGNGIETSYVKVKNAEEALKAVTMRD